MATQAELFSYVKTMLGTPYVDFELKDDELRTILKESVMPIFNRYFPSENTMALDALKDKSIWTDKPNEFWLREPENLQIFSIKNVLPNYGDFIVSGYPIDAGFRTFDQIPQWAEQVTRAETAYLHSPIQITWKFLPPNKIRIMPIHMSKGQFTIKYTREHRLDLSTVENQYYQYLRDLFYAHVQVALGRLRKKYQSLNQTPFGELPLNGDDLINEGLDTIKTLIDLFENKALPNIRIRVS